MKRTQIYLDEDLYQALKVKSQQTGKTLSELIRETLRHNFNQKQTLFTKALENVVGMWADQNIDVNTYIRQMRKDRKP